MCERWFGALLRLVPARFRKRHGDAMRDTFSGACAEHRARGHLALAGFLVRTTVDLIASSVRERLAPRVRAGAGTHGSLTGNRFAPVSWLDAKLGLRMLAKHPGLTLVSTFALAVGIPVGLAPDHFVDGLTAPLPVPRGERVRSLRLWSPALGHVETTTTYDYEAWRDALTSFEELGAFRETAYNVDPDGTGGAAVSGAEVTASTFDALRVPPILGRPIQAADETPGAEQVVVLGYDLWQTRYAADPGIVGRVLRLGGTPHTVVGVMPEGFRFPEHQGLWTPLPGARSVTAVSAVPVRIFGRLAAGVSDAQADAEFALAGQRSALPGSHRRVIPQIGPFAYIVLGGLNGDLRDTTEYRAFRVLALLILLVACGNVGMLVFARTASRAGELSVRTALGATRARIVSQVFVECLVLAVLASGVGLLLLEAVFRLMWRVLPAGWASVLPYWIDWSVGPATAVRALALAGLSAAVAGVIPALRFTGKSVQSNIQRARARRTGLRFGGLSGVLIVADVAVAVGAVGFAMAASERVRSAGAGGDIVGIPASEYLAAAVRLPSPSGDEVGNADGAVPGRVWGPSLEELVRRLRAEPEVRGVAVADVLPRMEHGSQRVEVEGIESPPDSRGFSTRIAHVVPDYFVSLDQPILAGRDFDASDVEGERATVIVNTTFVDKVLGGRKAVGRRVRFVPWGDGEPGPWKEIVGVVGHLGMHVISEENDQGVYEPMAPGELGRVNLGIHLGADPGSFATRLRTVAGQVDPRMIVSVTGPLDHVYEGDWYLLVAMTLGAGLLVGVLLAVAASGLYAIMSFAVAQRTREIGIRAALGAARGELVVSVARRALAQLGMGVVLGMPLAAVFIFQDSAAYAGTGWTLGVGAGVMFLVGLVACTGPTLRALRVHPGEALRGEG